MKMRVEIDGKLFEEVRVLAEREGRSEREILDEAVRRHLERKDPRRFEALLERMSSRFDLDEEEAERIAYEELHAMRRERRGGG